MAKQSKGQPTKGEALKALARLGITNDREAKELGYNNMEAVIHDIGKNFKKDGKDYGVHKEAGKLAPFGRRENDRPRG